ncbi:hypothetical protein DRN76_03545 [Methanosarcinales archaeon]|nr:MAG: hypothetical protein DRN76_03545 [Methanosarcinales archaeon]
MGMPHIIAFSDKKMKHETIMNENPEFKPNIERKGSVPQTCYVLSDAPGGWYRAVSDNEIRRCEI